MIETTIIRSLTDDMSHQEHFTALVIKHRIFNNHLLQLTLKTLIKTLTIGAAAIMMLMIRDTRNNQPTTVKLVNGKTSFLKVMPKVIHNMATTVTTVIVLNTKPTPVKKTT